MSGSESATLAPTQPKAGFRSKVRAVFQRAPKSNGGVVSTKQEFRGTVAGIPHKKDVPVLEAHDATGISLNEPPTTIENTLLSAHDTSKAEPQAPAKLPLTVPFLSVEEQLCPIQELWNQAYTELAVQEEELIKDYESCLSEDFSVATGLGMSLSSLNKEKRQEQMEKLLRRKLEEVKRNAWKLKFGGKDIAAKDLAQPVVGIIKWADDYLSPALASNPYASVAWSGITLLLPLVLNPSSQAASFAQGLSTISDLIVRSKLREDLYERRYGSKNKAGDKELLLSSHTMYRDTLKTLYIQILKFQASSICYLSKKGAFRLGLDIVKWNDWDTAMSDIQKQEDSFCKVYDIWQDMVYQEECQALEARHEESMNQLTILCGDVSSLRQAIEDSQKDAKRTELLNWISDIDYSENFNAAIAKHEENTGNWLLSDSELFETWQTTPNSLLWLNGKAGSGKSVLCAAAIKHLRDAHDSNTNTALAYYFFSFNDVKKQNATGMLSSIIKQLCYRRPDTPVSVESLSEYKLKRERPDMKTLEEMLLATMHGFQHVYVVLNAVDECPAEIGTRNTSRSVLLESLLRIRGKAPDSLHLFLTSRREFDIQAELKTTSRNSGAPPPVIDLDLTSARSVVDHDIGLHIDQTFLKNPFRSWGSDIKDEAKSALIKNADGMFQYVSCQFDSLGSHNSPKRIREALRDLPKGLNATYDRILKAVDPQYRKQIASTLKWLAFSLRPLLLEELAEIFILDPEKSPPLDEDDRLSPSEAVLKYLPGLVTEVAVIFDEYTSVRYLNDSREIRFAHFSIKEYLSSDHMAESYFSTRDPDASHLHIAECCLAYHLQLSQTILVTDETLLQYALWEYVLGYGLKHLEMVPRGFWTGSTTNRVNFVFTAKSQAFLNQELNLQKLYDEYDSTLPPLHYASRIGLLHVASYLIENGADVNEVAPGSRFGTALGAAAWGGHENIINLLVERHASIDADIGEYGKALQAAAATGRLGSVQLLLDRGANVNAEGGEYGSVLQAAAHGGKLEVVQLLLDHGANINAGGGKFGSALQAAAYYGNLEGVQLLLNRGANVNARGGWGSALQAAARRGELELVQLLLDRGANVNAEGGGYGSALQAAACGGKLELVQLLLNRGANAHAKGGRYGNALQAAIASDCKGCLKIAKLLLSRAATVDLPGEEWEKLLNNCDRYRGSEQSERLREFQKDPDGYIERREREKREEQWW